MSAMADLMGVRFQEPGWLHGLWVLPLIVLLYIVRRRAVPVQVPHLPLWEKVLAGVHSRRPRLLRALVSLLLQLAVAACLVLVVAGPYLQVSRAGRGHTLVVLDRRLGTALQLPGGGFLADAVVARGRELLDEGLQTGTVSSGVLAAGRLLPAIPTTADPGRVARGLSALGRPRGAGSVTALVEAVAAFRGDLPSRCVLVTPFRLTAEERELLSSAEWAVVGVGPFPGNGGIRAVQRRAGGLEVLVDRGEGSRELQLRLGEQVVERHAVETRERVRLREPRDEGRGARELVLTPRDAFPGDDLAPLAPPAGHPLRVLVVARDPTPYLDAFLAASPLIDRQRSGRTGPDEVESLEGLAAGYEVVIMVGCRWERPLPDGAFLLLGSRAPGLPLEVDAEESGPAQALDVRREDPLVRALRLADWGIVEMPRYRALPGLQVIVEGSLGPLVSRGRAEGTQFVHVAVTPDARVSNLPLMAAFPLMMDAALAELGGRDAMQPAPVQRAGGTLVLLPGERPLLTSREGTQLRLPPLPGGAGYRLPERTGLFELAGDHGGRPLALALLDHPGLPRAPLERESPPAPFPPVEEARSLRVELLLAAGGLLLLEWLLHRLALTD